jgi:hypothetical protein
VLIEKSIVEGEAETCFLKKKKKKEWDEQGRSKGVAIQTRVYKWYTNEES